MNQIFYSRRLLLLILFVFIVLSSGCSGNTKPDYREITLSKYVPATSASDYLQEDIERTSQTVVSCETQLKAVKNGEELRSVKVACFGLFNIQIYSISDMCDNKDVLIAKLDDIGQSLQRKVSLNCPTGESAESIECVIKEAANHLRGSVGIYEENVNHCINNIESQDRNAAETEMLNYLRWLKKVITEVENI